MRTVKLFLALLFLPMLLQAQNGPQLYNMGFDEWSKSKGIWYPYAAGAGASQRIWDSGNAGLHTVGLTSVTPEYEHVAVPGKGKAAARIESRKIAWAFIAGNIFSGKFVRMVEMKGVETQLGAPFTARPKSLSGYYHYIPRKINRTKAPYEDKEGKSDEGLIEILLMDWDKPQKQLTHIDGFLDPANDPHIIGIAQLIIKKGTPGYIHFEIPFTYRNGKTPRYAAFSITGSRFGVNDTGASGTVLYVDELKFNY